MSGRVGGSCWVSSVLKGVFFIFWGVGSYIRVGVSPCWVLSILARGDFVFWNFGLEISDSFWASRGFCHVSGDRGSVRVLSGQDCVIVVI